MRTQIFHSVNSGLFFWDGRDGLLVDGIHQGGQGGFSAMPDILSTQLRRGSGLFAHLTGVLFTHLHSDHFDAGGLGTLLQARPQLPVYGPGLSGPVLMRPIRPGLCSVRMGGSYILAKDTLHDGGPYRDTPHQSYLLRMGGESLFIAGDAALRSADAADFSSFYGAPVTAGFFNLYQLASPEAQAFIRTLAPGRVFLYHLPFQKDDRYHYHQLAQQVLRTYPPTLPKVEPLGHMAWLDGQAADLKRIEGSAQP